MVVTKTLQVLTVKELVQILYCVFVFSIFLLLEKTHFYNSKIILGHGENYITECKIQ